MAKHDPMDLEVRSQALFRAFYRFHKHSRDAWYIKDANHRYADASLTFLSRFLPSGLTSAIGLSDTDITLATERDIKVMHDFESWVMTQGKEIALLSWKYFSDRNDVEAFILKMKPYQYGEETGIMVFASSLDEFNKKNEWLPSLIADSDLAYPATVFDKILNINPLSYVTENEWEVAWLLICGCSIRWIAKYFDIKSQAVNIKSRNVYMKLRVFNKEGLIKAANKYGWVNIIPERFVSASTLIRIS